MSGAASLRAPVGPKSRETQRFCRPRASRAAAS